MYFSSCYIFLFLKISLAKNKENVEANAAEAEIKPKRPLDVLEKQWEDSIAVCASSHSHFIPFHSLRVLSSHSYTLQQDKAAGQEAVEFDSEDEEEEVVPPISATPVAVSAANDEGNGCTPPSLPAELIAEAFSGKAPAFTVEQKAPRLAGNDKEEEQQVDEEEESKLEKVAGLSVMDRLCASIRANFVSQKETFLQTFCSFEEDEDDSRFSRFAPAKTNSRYFSFHWQGSSPMRNNKVQKNDLTLNTCSFVAAGSPFLRISCGNPNPSRAPFRWFPPSFPRRFSLVLLPQRLTELLFLT